MRIETTRSKAPAPETISVSNQEPDHNLVNLAKQGLQSAFGILFQRYERRMLLIANRILRNQQDAEDAVQQAFTHAFVHLDAFQGDARFSTWLTRIAINESLQLLRKRRPNHSSVNEPKTGDVEAHPLQIADAAATPEEHCDQHGLSGILHKAIGELKPIFRSVVQMHEIGELTSEKTAQLLGLSNGVVKARTFRARRLLRRKLCARLGIKRNSSHEFLFAASRSGYGNPQRAGTLAHAL
jgi:RNA polymerase sigma-70 factor, ECF subfamily